MELTDGSIFPDVEPIIVRLNHSMKSNKKLLELFSTYEITEVSTLKEGLKLCGIKTDKKIAHVVVMKDVLYSHTFRRLNNGNATYFFRCLRNFRNVETKERVNVKFRNVNNGKIEEKAISVFNTNEKSLSEIEVLEGDYLCDAYLVNANIFCLYDDYGHLFE